MTIIFKGNQAFPHLIENFVCGCDNVRLMKYCYVLSSIEEGDIIYNHLTGTTVLIPKNTVREFLRTEYAQKNYFSVPVDFDEDSCFNDQLTSKLSKELREKEKIEGSIKALYGAFLRERQKNNQRRNIYSEEQLSCWIQTYGSPLYAFRKDDFIATYTRLLKAFQKEYSKYRIAYSYKTNYTPGICKIIKDLGGYAEVVSDFELDIARKLGYRDEEIIFNGPCKGDAVETFLLHGGMLNIDDLEELSRVCNIADKYPNEKIEIGIRLNFDIGQEDMSRFGIVATENSIEEIKRVVAIRSNMRIVGLHFHSGELSLDSWTKRVNGVLKAIDKHFPQGLKYIDIGSGMHERYFYDKATPNINDIRTLENYASVAIRPFFEFYRDRPEEERPLLFTEPGTLLIKECVDLVTQVKSIKYNKSKTFVIVDASKFNLGTESYNDHRPLLVVNTSNREKQNLRNASIVGYTCMESDKLFVGFDGEIAVLDCLVFGDVGAYSSVEKPPFIMPNCAMIGIDANGEYLLKRAETYDYLLDTYVMD